MTTIRTARGKYIDMNRLSTQNELSVAVSNVKVNARGDELGPGGQIIRKVDDYESTASSKIPAQTYKAPAKPAATATPAPAATATPAPAPVMPTFTPVTESLPLALSNPSKPNNNKGK